MDIEQKSRSVNNQDHPHQEGQQNNTPSTQDTNNQRRSDNNNQPMSSMMNESEEQKSGDTRGRKDEGDVQQQERQA